MDATTPGRIVQMLGAVNDIQKSESQFARSLAYGLLFDQLSRDELAALAGTLAEGNAFGPDAARRYAGVVA